ncbi:MAG: amidohydrolase [Gelidibacter sp.]
MATQDLHIALIQPILVWEHPEQNRLNFTKHIENLPDTVDLVVLPEMFTTGFTMKASEVAETMDGNTVKWMVALAKKQKLAITGSIVIKENGNFYNRLLFVYPDGTFKTYDKRHTFTLAGEHNTYTAGSHKLIVDYKGWKLCPLVCYDLRFPVWARNVEDYDVLIYVANWPKVRMTAWDALLKARAIENMCFCIGVNRVGLDGNNHEYTGHSSTYDVLGNRLDSITGDKEVTEIVTLSKRELETYRAKLNFLNDKDDFSLKV